ncbi:MAG: hypothetical protein AAF439_04335 [Pseudomonadota bacterium]
MANGKFAIAVSLVGNDGPRVFTATPAADPSSSAWKTPSSIWTEQPSGLTLESVSDFTIGAKSGDTVPVVIATASRDGKNHDRYVVVGGSQPWEPSPIPQNAHRDDGGDPILAMVIGTHPKHDLIGTYTLYLVGKTLQLGFDSLRTPENEKRTNGKIIHIDMDVPVGTADIAAVDARSGGSDVFAIADGIYHYDLNAQRQEAAPIRIADLPSGSDGEIAALADADTFAIWSLRGGVLSYLSGPITDQPKWSTLLPLRRDVGQIAALRNRSRQANQLFDVDASNKVSYFYQDPGSTIWQQTPIHLPDTGKAVEVPSYTTVLSFNETSGAPWRGQVELAATGWLYASVNGQSHVFGPDSKVTMQTDALGRITVVARIAAASTPMIEVSSSAFAEVIDVNPAAIVNRNLKAFSNAATLQAARTQTGEPVIGGDAKITADQAAQAFSMLNAAIDAATTTTLTVRQPGQAPANRIDPARLKQAVPEPAMLLASDNTQLSKAEGLAESVAAFDLADGLSSSIEASFGDLWDTISGGLEKAADWALQIAADAGGHVLKFVVRLADGVAHFILDTVEKALQVLSWVLEQIEVGLKKLIHWLGEMLGWDDVLATQKVVVNSFNKLLDWTAEKAGDIKETVDDGLDEALETVQGLDPQKVPDETPLSLAEKQRADDKDGASPDSPGGSFAAYHMQHSGSLNHAPSISAALDKTITDFLDMAEQTAKAEVDGWKTIFKDILDGLKAGSLSIGDLMLKVFSDQLAGTIKVTKIVADGALDIFQDLVNLLKAILNHAADIPFFSALFRLISGTTDSFLNVFAFMFSISTTQALRVMGVGDIAKKAAPLTDENLSPDAFFELVQSDLDDKGRITSETALIYNRIAGAVSIEITAMIDLMTTLDVATGHFASKAFLPFRLMFTALRLPMKLPAVTDGASKVRMVSYVVSFLTTVGSTIAGLALGPVGTAVSAITLGLLGAGASYIATVAIGIMAAVATPASAANYLLIWATTSTNLCNAVETGVQAVIAALIAVSGPENPEITLILIAVGVVFTVWFAIRPLLNGARLGLLIATGSGRPYWAG